MLSREDEYQLKQYCEKDEKVSRLIHHLEESHRMNLSRISHEIRNPITLINSFLQLTQKKHPEVIEFKTWNPIIENMEYLKQLLEELSDYNNSGILHKELFLRLPFWSLLFLPVSRLYIRFRFPSKRSPRYHQPVLIRPGFNPLS